MEMFSPILAIMASRNFLDREIGVLDIGLFQKTDLGIEPLHFSFDDLIDHLLQVFLLPGPGFDKFPFSLSKTSAGISSLLMYWGLAAAICMAIFFTKV